MDFNALVEEKIKVNKSTNVFGWIDNINNAKEAENNGVVFFLRLGVFFYFVCCIFLFHWLYLLCVKAHLSRIFNGHVAEYANKHGHDKKYWITKIDQEIKKRKEEFFKQNKLDLMKDAEKFENDED